MDNPKPKFRKFIANNWEQTIATKEHREQIKGFSAITFEMAKGNTDYIVELIKKINKSTYSIYNSFIEYLSTNEILKLSNQFLIWESLNYLLKEHQHFSNSNWALTNEQLQPLEKIKEKLTPKDLFLLHKLFFSKKNHYYWYDSDWELSEKKLKDIQIKALNKIYQIDQLDSIIKFIEEVEDPIKIGSSFAQIASKENDKELLPKFLPKFLNPPTLSKKEEFIREYVWARYDKEKNADWLENLNIKNWSKTEKCNILLFLPFKKEIWAKVDEWLQKDAINYWQETKGNPYDEKENLLPAIKNLLKYNRPKFAFDCVYVHYRLKKRTVRRTCY